jgi:hypothetical protein
MALVATCILGATQFWSGGDILALLTKIDDGATVIQVLRFVQKLRPGKFEFGSVFIGYNRATGVADAVGIDYWLGMKRLPDDAICKRSSQTRMISASGEWAARTGSARPEAMAARLKPSAARRDVVWV